jgi:hypothetical protein
MKPGGRIAVVKNSDSGKPERNKTKEKTNAKSTGRDSS